MALPNRIVHPYKAANCDDARAGTGLAARRPVDAAALGACDAGALPDLVRRLQDAIRRKDRFLAVCAHELRNPLGPLSNAHRVLARSQALDAHQRAALEMAERQTAQLARLVDDLLDAARIQGGKIDLQLEPVDVQGAVRDAIASVAPAMAARGQRLRMAMPARPGRILADAGRVGQILVNLLNNASKYTPDGGTIRVAMRDGPDGVSIEISDNGAGIEPHRLREIFELFSQVDATLDRAQGGLGIGLALVRELAELHGGSVSAASAGAGAGAQFTVRLPRNGPTLPATTG